MDRLKRLVVIVAVGIVVIVAVLGGAISDRLFGYRVLDKIFPRQNQPSFRVNTDNQKVLNEESVVIDVAQRVSLSVVTIGITRTQQPAPAFPPGFDDFPFFFGLPESTPSPSQPGQSIEQDVATGFIISPDGLIVTSKHAVGGATSKYRVITKDDKTYDVKKIYRDPANDIAILKIDASGLQPVEMGDSSKLKVGQFVIAIGTALGEFRDTVTTGVVSGLGRGITAGSPLEGYAEKLDDVIQTDAAINPGNSGGPLLNSAGQVIGINTAVAVEGQNIGFALPINLVKESIDNFNKTGQFSRAFLGVRYQEISREAAIMNELPEGVYVQEVISGSSADKAGIKQGDILTHMDDKRISETNGGLAKIISDKKVGDSASITLWRDGKTIKVNAVLKESEG